MANSPYLTDQAVLGASPEVMGLERGRKLADLLTASAFKQPQGEMVSGHYVKPAFTQQINPLVNALVGTTMNKNLDEQQTQMAAMLRSEEAKDLAIYQELKATEGPVAANAYLARSKSAELRKHGLAQTFAPPITVNDDQSVLEANTYNPLYKGPGKLPSATQLAIVNLGLPKDQTTWTPEQRKMAANYIPPEKQQELDISRANLALSQQKAAQEKINPAEAGLRTSFLGQIQPHVHISQSYRKIISAPETAAGDLSLIYGYMKILDDGSAVKEGEFANADNARGVPEAIRAQYNKTLNGQRLAPNQRKDFVQSAGDLVNSQKQQFETQKKYYSDISNQYKINPANIIYDPYADLDIKTTPPKAPKSTFSPNQQLNIPVAKPKFLGFE